LLSLLLGYFLVFLLFGIIKGRHELITYSEGEHSIDYSFHSQNFSLTLSGLSVTAIALFVSLNYDSLTDFASIILFFSISFIALALSWNLVRFPRRFHRFVSNILSDIGVLSIGCGFLVFFYKNLGAIIEVTVLYVIFIIAFLALALLELNKYNKYWSQNVKAKEKEKPSQLQVTNYVNESALDRLNLFEAVVFAIYGNWLIALVTEKISFMRYPLVYNIFGIWYQEICIALAFSCLIILFAFSIFNPIRVNKRLLLILYIGHVIGIYGAFFVEDITNKSNVIFFLIGLTLFFLTFFLELKRIQLHRINKQPNPPTP
jgi:hypothetical protein